MTGHPPQLAAIARAASAVADAGSLSVTLPVLADAVRSAAGIAAAQVVTIHDDGHLRTAGMSGFATGTGDFTTRLAECRRRGADLVMLRVLDTSRHAVVPHRRAAVLADPRWAPIHPLLASADWDGFACVPLIVRGGPVGLLTAFFPPGADPGPAELEVLTAIADQAAMAVDYTALLAGARRRSRVVRNRRAHAPVGGRTSTITVVVVGDHAVVRRGLTAVLGDAADIRVIGEAGDIPAALGLLDRLAVTGRPPGVLLAHLRLPDAGTIRLVTERFPTVRVVVLTSSGEVERVNAAMAAGAAGYLLKDAEPAEITAAVRAAAAGEVYLDPLVARRLTQRLAAPAAGPAALTARERDVLALVATGCSNQQIADRLFITERTARTHLSNILAKLRVTSRTQAALVAIREGLTTMAGAE